MTRIVFTFDTTHHALWAEEVAGERGIPAEVIPAPPAARARCNLALETLPEEVDALAAALDDVGVPYGRWEAEAVPTPAPLIPVRETKRDMTS